MNRFPRRLVLRGAGVALTLPWLESLLPTKQAQAQAASAPKRFIPIFLPNGAVHDMLDVWKPAGAGVGAAWTLSPILDVFADLKAKMNVLSNFENGSVFNVDGSSSVEPSHGRQPGAWLTGMSPDLEKEKLGNVEEANGISVDQIMAKHAMFANKTGIPSLQLGLSTTESVCDGRPCSNSRSVSWSAPTTPKYKQVDPQDVFNKQMGVVKTGTNDPQMPDVEGMKRLARNKSVIDAVLENATRTQTKLGAADRGRFDEFLTAVREVEKRVTAVSMGMGGVACAAITTPTMSMVSSKTARQTTATYNKGTHADVMNDLIVMALKCDATRIITYMLEDERSEFTYDHVTMRKFTATGSTESTGTCPEWHGGGQHGSVDSFATITRWNADKVFALCKKLDEAKEADGTSILDNTVVFFGGAMRGSNHSCHELPTALLGGGNIGLSQDQHVVLNNRPLRHLHFTLMTKIFGMTDQTDFGYDRTGAPIQLVNEILA
jgi:hypothetical protein